MQPNNTLPGSGAAAFLYGGAFIPATAQLEGSAHLVGTGPGFWVLTPVSGFAANKFHFVFYNNDATWLVRIHAVVYLPGTSTVTGVLPSEWTLRRRESPTTAPSGAGGLTIQTMDSGVVPSPLVLSAFNAPGTAPAGGTTRDVLAFVPQPDEQKLTTLDAPTMASLQPFAGVSLYDAGKLWPMTPLTLRQNQTLEVQQSGTAGTGNCRIWCAGRLEYA